VIAAALVRFQLTDPRPAMRQRALAALERELIAFDPLLDRHLTDEEEIVIPVMLDKGEAALGL
jgi:hypothetical protein